jgi:TolB protein
VVKSGVTKEGSGFTLDFKVYNVLDKQAVAVSPSRFEGVSSGAVRGKVHEFCNALIEALTGQPGFFGRRIAYSAKSGDWARSIYTMDSDGHGASAVVSNGQINSLPTFAGGAIVYNFQGDGSYPVLRIGGKPLSKDPGKYRKAELGPNGVYAVSVDTGENSDIWLMDKSGKLLQNLTQGQGDNVSPSWSPDGSKIAFVSNRSGGPQIYVMNADGSGQRRLTMAGAYNSTPDFGPDNLIVFAGLDDGTSDIFTVDLEGGVRRLTQGQGWNKDPAFSPDGRWIAFVSDRNKGRIFLMTSDGRYQFPLSQRPCDCATPVWE